MLNVKSAIINIIGTIMKMWLKPEITINYSDIMITVIILFSR